MPSGSALASGLVDVAIAVTLIEGAVLWVVHRRTGRGLAPRRVLTGLGAGLLLMFGIRAALAGMSWVWLAGCLAGAGIAHGIDLAARWQRE